MRVTGGVHSGRILKVPKGLNVRPTPDLVKQALFNSLGTRVVGARVLELFAGTGALSLECLSRGAVFAYCIESSHRHAEVLNQNSESMGFDKSRLAVRVQNAFTAIQQLVAAGEKFDLVLADPPYGDKNVGRRSESFAQKLLDEPQLSTLLNLGGLFVLGHTKRDTLTLTARWKVAKTLKHGDSIMRFLAKIPEGEPE